MREPLSFRPELFSYLEPMEARLLLDAVRPPFLQGLTTTSIYVCLEATNTTTATVDYGLTSSYGLAATTQTTQSTNNGTRAVHNIKVTGLTPNTLYHYRVRQGATTTVDYTFRTAPLPGTPARWMDTGDVHTNPDVHDAMVATMGSLNPGLITMTGDIIRDGYGYAEWENAWFTPGQTKIMTTIPWAEAIGNHEYMPGDGFRAYAWEQAPDGVDDGYYSFDYGDAHIVVLKFGWDPLVEGDAQWNWVKADLAATTQKWKFVIYHHPAYSYGGHGSDSVSINLTTKVLEPAGVDFVFNGHQHFYQDVLVNGIHHIVAVMSGGLRTPEPVPAGQPGVIGGMEQAFSFLQVDTTAWKVTVTAKRVDGSIIQTITKTKDATPPTTTTGLAAVGIAETQVQLNWDAASDADSGIDLYNIYRNGVLVGTSNTTTFIDTGLTRSTGYTYRVAAVNLGGIEGALSDPAVGTTTGDTTRPTVRGVYSGFANEVKVVFDEPLDPLTAQNPLNYNIPGITVTGAVLEADTITVRLTTSTLSTAPAYTVSVTNVTDTSGNPVLPGSSKTFKHQAWQDANIGTITGGSSTYLNGLFTITADGAGIGGTADGFHYVYRTLAGGGEIVTKVTNNPASASDKSGVMIRSALTAGAPEVSLTLGGAAGTLVNYYSFDSTLNDTAGDYIQNGGANATNLTAVYGTGGSVLRYAAGMKGNALQLHVLADDVLCARSTASNADINLGNAWTVELWLNPTAEAWTWARLVRAVAGTVMPWSLQYNMGKFFYANADAQTAWGAQIALNQWQHIAAVADPGTGLISIYRNGVLAATAAYDGATAAPAAGAYLEVGSAEDTTGYYDLKAYIDEVATWKEPLTQATLAAHFAAGAAGYGLIPAGSTGAETWFQTRSTTGAASSDWSPSATGAPYYTKLVRKGGTFTSFVSPSGLPGTWVQTGPATTIASMASGAVYVGLAVASGTSGSSQTFTQENVQVIDYVATTPANLAASPLSYTQIQLTWDAAVDPEFGIDHYNIYRDSVLIGTTPAGTLTYTDTGLAELTTYSYEVSAVNGAVSESPKAGPVAGTTPADTIAPAIVSAKWKWEDLLWVAFDQPVAAASAQNIANYAILCGTQYVKVLTATLQADNVTVALTATDLDPARSYSLVVNNVTDRAATPNPVAANSTLALPYAGWVSQDVGTPATAGSSGYDAATGVYTIQAGNTGLGAATSDGFFFVARSFNFDVDIICRVVSLPATGKAGLMVRSSMASNSMYGGMFLDGTTGGAKFQKRTGTGALAVVRGVSLTPAPYYLRLSLNRTPFEDTITQWISPSGTPNSWTALSSASLPPSTDPYYVGLAATTSGAAAGSFVIDNVQVTESQAPANDNPAGAPNAYSMPWNSVLTVPYTAGLLVNDSDSNGNSLAASVQTNVAHGELTLSGNGAFVYTPTPGFSGTDSFVYTLDDGHGGTATATATITVADNVAPLVTVNTLATNDNTPALTGTVNDPAASVSVTLAGHTFPAVNNGNGTWTLADNAIAPALARGVYNVQVTATDVFANAASDATDAELTVYSVAGDINLDNTVDLQDFGILKENFGSGTTYAHADLNGDALVDLQDFGILKEHFGQTGSFLTADETPAVPLAASRTAPVPTDSTDTASTWDALESLIAPLDLAVSTWV